MKQRIIGFLLMSGASFFAGCEKAAEVAKPSEGEVAKSASRVVELNDTTFGAQPAQGVMLVDFWAPWCGPCQIQGPIVEKVSAQLGDTERVFKINVDQAPQTAQKYGISSIPTLIIFKNGKPVKQFVGVTSAKELVDAVKAVK